MRRPRSARIWSVPSSLDILKTFGAERLQLIGAIMLEWNRIEHWVDECLCHAIDIRTDQGIEVTSRINGFDGKVGIIKAAHEFPLCLPKKIATDLSATWGAMEAHKRYRDGIAHIFVLNPTDQIFDSIQRRGKKDEVLVSLDALNALYVRLSFLADEALLISQILSWRRSWYRDRWVKSRATDRRQSLRYFQRDLARFRRIQRKRLALPSLPDFPPAPSEAELDANLDEMTVQFFRSLGLSWKPRRRKRESAPPKG